MTYKQMLVKLKDKLYSADTKPVPQIGLETYALLKKKEKILELTEMRMLQMIQGVTLRTTRRNKEKRKEPYVVSSWKRDLRLIWFGHLERANEGKPPKDIMTQAVEGSRGKGREIFGRITLKEM